MYDILATDFTVASRSMASCHALLPVQHRSLVSARGHSLQSLDSVGYV